MVKRDQVVSTRFGSNRSSSYQLKERTMGPKFNLVDVLFSITNIKIVLRTARNYSFGTSQFWSVAFTELLSNKFT